MLEYMCVQSFMSTHTPCFMLIVKEKAIIMYIAGGWLLLVTSMLRCPDYGNVGLHVCAKFYNHTHH